MGQDFFQIVLHGADGQAVSLFGYEQGRSHPVVEEQLPDGQVVAERFDQLIVEMKGSGLAAFTYDVDLAGFEVDGVQIQAVNLTYPEPELIHEGINSVVTDSQDGFRVDCGKQGVYLVMGQGLGATAVAGTDFQDIVERQILCTRRVAQLEKIAVASQGEYLAVDRSAAVAPLLFQIILKVHDSRSVDGVVTACIDEVLEQIQVDAVGLQGLLAEVVDLPAIVEEAVDVAEKDAGCNAHWHLPWMETPSRAFWIM